MRNISCTCLCVLLVACSQAAPGPTAKEIYELREKCAEAARAWAGPNIPDVPMKSDRFPGIQPGLMLMPPALSNHYSVPQNRCYVQVDVTATGQKVAVQLALIVDVNENRQIGAFATKDSNVVTACEVNEKKCSTHDEWLTLAKPYMVD